MSQDVVHLKFRKIFAIANYRDIAKNNRCVADIRYAKPVYVITVSLFGDDIVINIKFPKPQTIFPEPNKWIVKEFFYRNLSLIRLISDGKSNWLIFL